MQQDILKVYDIVWVLKERTPIEMTIGMSDTAAP